jgi:DnaJ-related protein SCJ1
VKQALLGFKVDIPHLDKRTFSMERKDKVTVPGHVQRVKDKGMPVYHSETFGDLFVEFHVVFPVTFTPEARKGSIPFFFPNQNRVADLFSL